MGRGVNLVRVRYLIRHWPVFVVIPKKKNVDEQQFAHNFVDKAATVLEVADTTAQGVKLEHTQDDAGSAGAARLETGAGSAGAARLETGAAGLEAGAAALETEAGFGTIGASAMKLAKGLAGGGASSSEAGKDPAVPCCDATDPRERERCVPKCAAKKETGTAKAPAPEVASAAKKKNNGNVNDVDNAETAVEAAKLAPDVLGWAWDAVSDGSSAAEVPAAEVPAPTGASATPAAATAV